MPREPEVFGQPVSPWSSRVASTTRATSRIWGHMTPGTGSRSTRNSSGVIEIVGAHRMRMQLEAREVRHPGKRGIARHDLLGAAPGGKAKRHHLDPGRPRLGRALLIEELAADAVRIAHEHVGPAAGAAQRALGHREVVAREIQLGVSRLRKEHLARIRDRDLAARDNEQFRLAAFRHGGSAARDVGAHAKPASLPAQNPPSCLALSPPQPPSPPEPAAARGDEPSELLARKSSARLPSYQRTSDVSADRT